MARLPRLYAPSVVHHVLHETAPTRALFVDADDCLYFLDRMRDAAQRHGVNVHAFVLLPDRFELLATPGSIAAIPRMLQDVARRYVPRINARTGRAGTLWRSRFRSTLVDDASLLALMRYVESRPVVAGQSDTPARWRWSSFAHHAGYAAHPLVVDHAAYWALSDAPFERQAAYRGLCATPLEPALEENIRDAVMRGWAFGSDRFVDELAALTNRRVRRAPRGRPRLSPLKNGMSATSEK